jgi:hypothetical protein
MEFPQGGIFDAYMDLAEGLEALVGPEGRSGNRTFHPQSLLPENS